MRETFKSDRTRRSGSFAFAMSAGVMLAGAMLAGCASVDVPTTVDVTGMPNAEIALQKSMSEVDAEMDRIGRMQPRSVSAGMPTVVPGELDRIVSFEWNGPLDGAVEALAKTIGYRVAISAPPGAQPLVIGVRKAPQRVYDILEQIGDDAGSQATVRVDPQHQTVEVIHHV
ncbi:Defect in organelle trafficking protein DotD [Methylocella tundrae]|uniref:Defect in organelle trafficking protein DotD n=1 Tax=Methylocella tundrae TaxID=227605 RepID=A0A8B6M200_METTU|nr:DotD/TraH family lipoprotein [Methylocella tundrae]VTZ28021.1 Defect in organelle trafficking protein DotD [Methylocella tundrae]VTZ48785.1 Defect in organelle trafficking protein DotD [Methylocella tundrae]